MYKKLHFVALVISLAAAHSATLRAEAPAGYYNACENKSGAALLSALYNIIGEHTNVGYDGLWSVYETSDVRPNGTVWDMYSTKEWTPGRNQCGSYSVVGDCYNREHSMPKSWFNNASPMSSDAFHVVPTDGKVNGQRSNFPYGECANGTRLPNNGSIRALGRLGTSTFPGYSGRVFEPDDEYKGDFARNYFYMAACYNNRIASWSSDMLAGNAYPAFSPWAVELLMKWHIQDPVSDKERMRNDAVAAWQHNRNPFIDHPELADHIWGALKNQPWSSTATGPAIINRPSNASIIDMGSTAIGYPLQYTLVIKGTSLKEAVTVAVSGAGFSASVSSVSAAAAMTDSGVAIVLTYNATVVGEATGTLTLTSGEAQSIITLTAEAFDGLTARPADDVTDCEFDATWVYVGDDISGNYSLDVTEAGVSIEGYPRMVPAAAERYTVDGLEPSTTYCYTLRSHSLTSNRIFVTTTEPIPSVYILFDGNLFLSTGVGVPSDVAELLLEIDNIDCNIIIGVDEPFELSSDKASWTTRLTISPIQDRMYLRLLGDEAGDYVTSITVSAGDYFDDDAMVQGRISDGPTFIEDFETAGQSSYNTHSYNGRQTSWELTDAGIWAGDATYEGQQALRMGKRNSSSATMTDDKQLGLGCVTFMARGWSGTEGGTVNVDYSTDGGDTWTTAGSVVVSGVQYQAHSVEVNQSGDIRLRIAQAEGGRILIDYITATDCTNSGAAVTIGDADYHQWDAYCLGGRLTIEATRPTALSVYALDGTTLWHGEADGIITLDLPAGLYIVATADFSRRVVVK